MANEPILWDDLPHTSATMLRDVIILGSFGPQGKPKSSMKSELRVQGLGLSGFRVLHCCGAPVARLGFRV